MRLAIYSSVIILSLVTIIGCSTRLNPVGRNLLNIGNRLGKPTTEYGSMKVTETDLDVGHSFSAFLWPEHPTIPMDKLSEEVSTLSRNIDRFTKEYRERNFRIQREQGLWNSWRCNKETDKPSDQPDILDCEKIVLETGVQAACGCILANEPKLKAQNLENLNKRMEMGQVIVSMVEDDFDPGKNWLLGGGDVQYRVGSVLKLRPPTSAGNFEVYLRLKHFGKEDMSYKTPAMEKKPIQQCDPDGQNCKPSCTDGLELFMTHTRTLTCVTPDKDENEGKILSAAYDASKRSLFFVVFEKVDGKYNGNMYFFKMERGFAPEGSPDLVRFKGDMAKYDLTGKRTGIGAAKFDGEWSSEF